MIRRFDDPPKAGINYRLRPGAYAILMRDHRVLLTFQEAPKPEYQIPGGGIDPGEHIIPALRREIMEETGWTIGTPRRLGAFRRYVYMPDYKFWAEKLCALYVARPAIQLCEPTEAGHSSHWVSYEDALTLTENPGDRHFLKHALRTFG
ncbi:MAG: NUDIX hydrolase [Planktotalea sp.]|uniref:NUDIX domain-containing protein n=1 Tax=Planktotalea sp. TaxID=2029877 RepID=UPI003C76A891